MWTLLQVISQFMGSCDCELRLIHIKVVVGLALLAGWVYWYKRKHTSKNKGPGGAAHACEPLTQEESHEEHMHKYLDERV